MRAQKKKLMNFKCGCFPPFSFLASRKEKKAGKKKESLLAGGTGP